MKYLTVQHVLRIHELVIETSGGNTTILDMGNIDSEVARPRMAFGGESLYVAIGRLVSWAVDVIYQSRVIG